MGRAINFEAPARSRSASSIANACYRIEEFHFDGFRLDATQQILTPRSRVSWPKCGTGHRSAGTGVS
jgi:1,4-alpha-glucan branching enzyme